MIKIKLGSSDFYNVEYIRFDNEEKTRLAIRFVSASELRRFDRSLISNNGIGVYTEDRLLITSYGGYSTIYKIVSKDMILSSDGSVFDGEIDDDEEEKTLDELKEDKIKLMSKTCEDIIHNGVDVLLESGEVKHFSLSTNDQLNLFGKRVQLEVGNESSVFEYHADGEPCKFFSYSDMSKIIEYSMYYVSFHTTYVNSMFSWIRGCTSKEELDNIVYGMDIPEEFQSSVLKYYIENQKK